MKVNSIFLGEQEVDPDTVITFPKGIPGFEGKTQYKLFNEEGKPSIYWLQSLDDPAITFSMALPETFGFAYEMSLSDEEVALLEADDPARVTVMVLLSRPNDEKSSDDTAQAESGVRANLNGPLLLNVDKRLAMQKVLPKTEQITLIRSVSD